ncbi:MAG TPA: DEAD/DEAH box helicase [Candidatus Nanoarchaeia archaeon]|nr:DEAD/DEAH box helicase [Candidatus Nanoarchaeia archaeon]
MLQNFTPRLYQETIFATTVKKNTLVVLPTGLGKTAIALLLTIQRLRQYPQSKIVFLAPTKPLAEQHSTTFKTHLKLSEEKFALFTGALSPEKRHKQWGTAQIIIGTPQGLENDILGDRISLEQVSLLIFDEAHHATGDYSYSFIAKQYNQKAKFPKILGLTASPGSDIEKIKEICKNLFIEAVEVRSLEDKDVVQYVKEINTEWVTVDLPDSFKAIHKLLKACYRSKLEKIKAAGYLNNLDLRKRELLDLQRQLHGEVQGNVEPNLLNSISWSAEALKVEHAIELLETQGIVPLFNYFEKLEMEARNAKSRASKNLAADENFKQAFILTAQLYEARIQHPKLIALTDFVEKEMQEKIKKIIVFTQIRDSGSEIVANINKLPNCSAKLFVGQAKKKDTGMSQKQQKEMLDEFRQDKFPILVCTSVGEEGLDIPEVDIVLFYEPIPSAIRHIQRRGRTGRQAVGRVIIFMTNDTRDAVYRWVAHHKEKRMHRTLETLKKELVLETQPQQPLSSFIKQEQKVQIVTDYREKGSEVMKQLIELGISLRLERLESADFLCSTQCAVEFKTLDDFVLSIVDGRLMEQLKNLKANFSKPLIILQGDQDIYTVRKVHPNAIRGMLATITVSFGIPLLQTKNAQETAALLAMIAKREQDTARDISLHSKKPLTMAEQQEYVVASFPNLGLKTAQQLLKHFQSIENLAKASIGDLQHVEGVGKITAERIKNVLTEKYIKD